MSITVYPELESRLRARAEAEGITVDAYVERLLLADQQPGGELQSLALEGIESGEPFEPGPGYWEAKHRSLDERLKAAASR
ncbi:MAG: hypothetical protein ABI823_13765 [Bryobacteraceae bacterium]